MAFRTLNRAYGDVFRPDALTLGLVVPIEAHGSAARPQLERHIERVQLAESLGFSAVWLRDVPFNVPSFGDAGQLFDPFVYLGALAASTEHIALGVASVVLPLRHPAHTAKAAASVDVLSGGRLLLGVASGDRPDEYPALAVPFGERGARFRDSYAYIRTMAESAPSFSNRFGVGAGIDLLPKPTTGRLPLLITGGSQQDDDWIARHGDGWMLYPRSPSLQARIIRGWRERVRAAGEADKPVMQPLYVDLRADEGPPEAIHLGLRTGIGGLRSHLQALHAAGVQHVALNLRFHRGDVEDAMQRVAAELLPTLPTNSRS